MNTLMFPNAALSTFESEHDPDIDVMLKDLFSEVHEVADNVKSFPTSSDSWTLSVPAVDTQPLSADSGRTSSGGSGQEVIALERRVESPGNSARAVRLAKKRMNQRIYREREKQQRQEANARLAELEAMLARLSVENSRLKLKNNALEMFVQSLDNLVAGLLHDGPIESDPHIDLTVLNNKPSLQVFKTFVSAKTAQDMTIAEFRKIWRFIVMEAAAVLLQVDAGNEQAERELAVACPCVERMMFNIKIMHPAMMDQLATMNLETGEMEDPGTDFFVRVVRGLNLTQEQMEQLLDESVIVGASTQLEEVRLRLLQEIGNFAAQSNQKLNSLRAFQEGQVVPQHSLHPCYYGCNSSAVASLEKMLKQEGLLGALLCSYVFNSVLTAKQKSLLSVSAYPYLTHAAFLLEAIKTVRAEQVQVAAANIIM